MPFEIHWQRQGERLRRQDIGQIHPQHLFHPPTSQFYIFRIIGSLDKVLLVIRRSLDIYCRLDYAHIHSRSLRTHGRRKYIVSPLSIYLNLREIHVFQALYHRFVPHLLLGAALWFLILRYVAILSQNPIIYCCTNPMQNSQPSSECWVIFGVRHISILI